jgi:hypothetical protein
MVRKGMTRINKAKKSTRNGKALLQTDDFQIASSDRNARLVSDALQPLLKAGLRFPRTGYLLRKGRGGVVVERLD